MKISGIYNKTGTEIRSFDENSVTEPEQYYGVYDTIRKKVLVESMNKYKADTEDYLSKEYGTDIPYSLEVRVITLSVQ